MKTAMVTVVITTYNHGRFIDRAVDSVLAQDVPFPYDVIVIDDHSDDGTVDILERLVRRHPGRIDLRLSPVNRNDHHEFGRALDECTTPYLAMLDGDDYWTATDKLARQVDLLERRPDYALVCHPVVLVDEDGRERGTQPETTQLRYVRDDLWTSCFVHTGSVVFRRSAFDRLPAWYFESEFGDWELFLLLTLRGDIGVTDEPMSAYRIHAGGAWSGVDEARRARQIHAFYEHMASAWGSGFTKNRAARQSSASTLAYRYGLSGERGAAWRWAIEAVIRANLPGASTHAPTRKETLRLISWLARTRRNERQPGVGS